MTRQLLAVALLAASTGAVLGVAPDARACGMPVFRDRGPDSGLYVMRRARNDLRVADRYLKQGRAGEALLMAESALEAQSLDLGPGLSTDETRRAHTIAGLAAAKLGQAEKALAHLDPSHVNDSPDVLEGRGTALAAAGRYEEAVASLAPVAELESLTPSGAVALARALQAMGRIGDARAALKVARALAPDSEDVLALAASLRLRPVSVTSVASAGHVPASTKLP